MDNVVRLPDRKSVDLVSEVTVALAKLIQKELPRIQKQVRIQYPDVKPASLVSATSFAFMETVATMIHTTSYAMFPNKPELGDAMIKNTKEYLDFYSEHVKKKILEVQKTVS